MISFNDTAGIYRKSICVNCWMSPHVGIGPGGVVQLAAASGGIWFYSPISELVINWHITEACNYGCKYCYSAWEKQKGARDVVKDMQASRELIREVYDYFRPSNTENPLYGQMQWQSVRLNFAGGEPLLYARQMPELVRFAHETGFNTSLITNGSRLTGALLDEIAPHMSWLGLSLDSADARINQRIGRMDRRGSQLGMAGLAKDIQAARAANPDLKLKVNTVVNAANANEVWLSPDRRAVGTQRNDHVYYPAVHVYMHERAQETLPPLHRGKAGRQATKGP